MAALEDKIAFVLDYVDEIQHFSNALKAQNDLLIECHFKLFDEM